MPAIFLHFRVLALSSADSVQAFFLCIYHSNNKIISMTFRSALMDLSADVTRASVGRVRGTSCRT